MAIKGKKRRGRTGSKRPAGAPRPMVGATRPPAWYSTRGFRIGAAAAAVIAILAVLLVVKNTRDSARALERKQDVLEDFTGDLQALLQDISPAASEMLVATADTKTLAEDAERWAKIFKDAQAQLTEATASASAEVDVPNRLIFQSVLEYTAAAETFKLVADAQGKLQSKIAERAAAQVSAADGTWTTAIVALDEKRTAAELGASGLRVPSAVSPSGGAPTPGAGLTPGGG